MHLGNGNTIPKMFILVLEVDHLTQGVFLVQFISKCAWMFLNKLASFPLFGFEDIYKTEVLDYGKNGPHLLQIHIVLFGDGQICWQASGSLL